MKPFSLALLAKNLAKERTAAAKVVLCHGCFDVLHPGHVAHLKEAAHLGEILAVTVTADRFIQKGPDRPSHSEELRARVVGALRCVNGVAIIEEPTALAAIRAIKPDVYVKGAEYAKSKDPVLRQEMAEVKRHGGETIFTVTESGDSASLWANRLYSSQPENVRAYLQSFAPMAPIWIKESLDAAQKLRVALVGETIIDQYIMGKVAGRPSKDAILALQKGEDEASFRMWAGGLAAMCRNAGPLAGVVAIFTDAANLGGEYARPSPAARVFLGRRATVKTRFVETGRENRKLFEVYRNAHPPITNKDRRRFLRGLERIPECADMVLVGDFGHGLIDRAAADKLSGMPVRLAVNAQTNAGNYGFNFVTKYPGADFVCVDENEARLTLAERDMPIPDLVRNLAKRMARFPNDFAAAIITRGHAGCVGFTLEDGYFEAPAIKSPLVDPMGAGDAFFVAAALTWKAGLALPLAAYIGNVAGAIKCGIMGHERSIERKELQAWALNLLKW